LPDRFDRSGAIVHQARQSPDDGRIESSAGDERRLACNVGGNLAGQI
jgi:hypothetical protein